MHHTLQLQRHLGKYRFPPHSHLDFAEIVLCFRGRLEHRIGADEESAGASRGTTLIQSPGDAVMVGVGESHALWGSAPAFANVIVPVTFLAPADQTIVEELTTYRRVAGIATAEIEACIERLIRESDDTLHRLRYYALLYELLAELAGAVPPARREAGDGRQAPGWLDALIRKLNRAQEIPQAAELPTWCGKSPEHIARSFAARLGVSPSHYLNRLRLSRAARLLQETNLRVIDIAEEVGFANQPYFQRLFKRRYGVAPGAYRRSGKRRAPS